MRKWGRICGTLRYMYIWSPSTNLSAYVHSKQTPLEFILKALGILKYSYRIVSLKLSNLNM